MKRSIIVILFVTAIIAACGQIKVLDPDLLEQAVGGTDDSTYPFETTLAGFGNNVFGDNICFKSVELSSERAYKGDKCVKVGAVFTGAANNRGGFFRMQNTTIALTGKTLTARVWVPAGMFDSSNPYGATLIIQLAPAPYAWYQSAWQNLQLPSAGVSGVWNTISVYTGNMTDENGDTTTAGHIKGWTPDQNGVTLDAQLVWGLKIGMGNSSTAYTGTMYIDSINIQ